MKSERALDKDKCDKIRKLSYNLPIDKLVWIPIFIGRGVGQFLISFRYGTPTRI